MGGFAQLAGLRNFAAVHQLREPMGTGRPRSFACALAALALIALLAPASPASTKKGNRHVFAFGSRSLARGTKGKDVRYLQRALTRLGVATSIDGVFGKGTMKSVKALEQLRGWPVNGVISKKDAKRIRKLLAKHRVSGSYFVAGYAVPILTLTSKKAGTASVKVLDGSGNLVQRIPVSFVGAESYDVGWNGIVDGGIVSDGTYQLKLADPGTAHDRASGQIQPFGMHLHAFPVPGPHTFGWADARFGAPRSGHVHQGQDIPAACGQKEIVDETGQVRVNAYQAGGAGYYVVLHGAITGTDSVYMHLKAPSWAPAGTNVYSGQQIGKVGATGDATGCHLHFERWSAPGWYVGGAAYDPLPELLYWDTYS
jgi:murein DD-endopeptidase MepM/ murein hydrolase activator NlpD